MEFGDKTEFSNPVELRSKVKWYKIHTDASFNYAMRINLSKLNSFNSLFDIEGLGQGFDFEYFKITTFPSRVVHSYNFDRI